MTDSKDQARELHRAIQNGDYATAEDTFNEMFLKKAAPRLNQERMEVGRSMFDKENN